MCVAWGDNSSSPIFGERNVQVPEFWSAHGPGQLPGRRSHVLQGLQLKQRTKNHADESRYEVWGDVRREERVVLILLSCYCHLHLDRFSWQDSTKPTAPGDYRHYVCLAYPLSHASRQRKTSGPRSGGKQTAAAGEWKLRVFFAADK